MNKDTERQDRAAGQGSQGSSQADLSTPPGAEQDQVEDSTGGSEPSPIPEPADDPAPQAETDRAGADEPQPAPAEAEPASAQSPPATGGEDRAADEPDREDDAAEAPDDESETRTEAAARGETGVGADTDAPAQGRFIAGEGSGDAAATTPVSPDGAGPSSLSDRLEALHDRIDLAASRLGVDADDEDDDLLDFGAGDLTDRFDDALDRFRQDDDGLLGRLGRDEDAGDDGGLDLIDRIRSRDDDDAGESSERPDFLASLFDGDRVSRSDVDLAFQAEGAVRFDRTDEDEDEHHELNFGAGFDFGSMGSGFASDPLDFPA